MPATYDSLTGRINLTGDGTTWNRTSGQLTAPPAGSNQAIYLLRYWMDTRAGNTDFRDSSLTWDTSFHIGFQFNSQTHPQKVNASVLDGYDDFFGMSAVGSGSAFTNGEFSTSDTVTTDDIDDFGMLAYDASSTNISIFSDGNGTGNGTGQYIFTGASTWSTKSTSEGNRCQLIPANPTTGATFTQVWRVYTDPSDERVWMESWVNTDSLDLNGLDLSSRDELNPDAPLVSIPDSHGWSTTTAKEINGAAETGTNWRPSSGTMAFPQYFVMMYPMLGQSFVLDYVGVQYSRITT